MKDDRVVITGIGLISAVGADRESTWQAVCRGEHAVAPLVGVPALPDGLLLAAAIPRPRGEWQLPTLPLARRAAAEAAADARLAGAVAPERLAFASVANFGTTPRMSDLLCGPRLAGTELPWWESWLPSTTTSGAAESVGALGLRTSCSAACASSSLALIRAVRALRAGECDAAISGAAETIHPLVAAGFYNMRVLAHHEDPSQACRPFDSRRSGFVMGEGAAMLVLERAGEAVRRGASIYAEITAAASCSDAHHVTDLNTDTTALEYVLRQTLAQSGLDADKIGYVNAHGTGTLQNDVTETRAVRHVFGAAADRLCMSSVKASLGHLVNAAGAVEVAITALALRDGFAPPTLNLTEPDPECDLDCIPLVGRQTPLEHALKISVAFGGHLAALALRRWTGAGERAAGFPARKIAAA